jgi:hypothetical protein
MNVCVCIGCGCDDENACLDSTTGQGCTWLRRDLQVQLGVCSCCPQHVQRWDAGDMEPTEEAMEAFAERTGEQAAEDPGLILPGDETFDTTLRYLRSR